MPSYSSVKVDSKNVCTKGMISRKKSASSYRDSIRCLERQRPLRNLNQPMVQCSNLPPMPCQDKSDWLRLLLAQRLQRQNAPRDLIRCQKTNTLWLWLTCQSWYEKFGISCLRVQNVKGRMKDEHAPSVEPVRRKWKELTTEVIMGQ